MPPKPPKPKKRRVWVTQIAVEVAWVVVVERRLTQQAIEVAEQVTGAEHRLTQQAIEVAEQVTGADRIARVTQVWLEVGYVFPVHPFGEQEGPKEPPWSPAYIQPPVESEAGITGALAGLHGQRVVLGKAPGYIQLDRQ